MSDDVNALTALFSGGQGAAVPATFYEYETGLTVPAAQTAQPAATDYSGLFKGAIGIGNAGRSIGAGRAAMRQGEIAQKIAQVEAEREKMKGRRLVSTGRAIAGAQGSAEGMPLVSELSILQAAHENANTKIYEGNVKAYEAREIAKAAYLRAPADLLSGLLGIDPEDPKEKKKAGKSLLTGR